MGMAVTTEQRASAPDHVPDSLVYDFDMRFDPALLADPHRRIWDLVSSAPPIFWSPFHGGHWIFLGHEAVFDAARDTDTFSSSFFSPEQRAALLRSAGPEVKHVPTAVPINLDPPEHTKYRLPLQGRFSPKSINALKDDIRQLAAALIDEVLPRGGCEFMSAVAEQLPVKVFMKMMGLPLERFHDYRQLVREHMALTTDPDPRKHLVQARRVADAMHDIFLARRDEPRDDLISHLWTIEVDGRKTSLEDMENYGVLLFVAGLDTVMQGMGHGVRYLASDLETQRLLRADPTLIPEGVEEILRRFTFTVPVRRVAKDTNFHGVELRANDRVALYLPAADLDPKQFEEPQTFNLARENKTHIAFNAGPHRCLGSHLARVELQILFEEMLGRVPEFRIDPTREPSFLGGNVISVEKMYLQWSA